MNILIDKLRTLLKDLGNRTTIVVVYNGNNIIPISLAVKSIISVRANGADVNYTFDNITNEITLDKTQLSGGDVVEIAFYYYKYSDDELQATIKSALYYLSIFNYKEIVIDSAGDPSPALSTREENLVAAIGEIMLSDNYYRKRYPDGMTESYPRKKSKRQIIEDLIYLFKGHQDYFDYLDVYAYWYWKVI